MHAPERPPLFGISAPLMGIPSLDPSHFIISHSRNGWNQQPIQPNFPPLQKPHPCTNINSQVPVSPPPLSFNTSTGEKLTDFVGSAFYVAPEVLQHSYGPEADIWSMGVVLYILLSGSPPFHDEERTEIFRKIETEEVHLDWGPWRRVSEGAKDLVHSMLNRDPSQRITTAQIKSML